MGADEDVGPVSHRFANAPHAVFAARELVQRKLAPALEAVRPGGVLLEGGEPHLDVLEGPLRRRVTIVVDVPEGFFG